VCKQDIRAVIQLSLNQIGVYIKAKDKARWIHRKIKKIKFENQKLQVYYNKVLVAEHAKQVEGVIVQ